MFGSDFEVGPKSKALVLKLATTSSSFFRISGPPAEPST